jgi:hypothetical protein
MYEDEDTQDMRDYAKLNVLECQNGCETRENVGDATTPHFLIERDHSKLAPVVWLRP